MKHNTFVKGLELILIPLFSLTMQSCDNNVKSNVITIDKNHKYFTTFDKSTKLLKATKEINPENTCYFFQLIDSTADGYVNTIRMGDNVRPADSCNQVEFKILYNHSDVQALLK